MQVLRPIILSFWIVFLHLPQPDPIPFPLDYGLLQTHQHANQGLLQHQQTDPNTFPMQSFGDNINLICYVQPDQPWCIALPTDLLEPILNWYQRILNHIGITRLVDTINVHFFHPQLHQKAIQIVSTCQVCQQLKLPGTPYGKLPPRNADAIPWREVAVDLIGPWTMKLNGTTLIFNALTCIDPVTNLVVLAH